jgi:hypothetical protein
MTVTLELSPEREAALKAQAQAQGLSVEQWLVQLADQYSPDRQPPISVEDQDLPPIWEVIADNMKHVPPEDLALLPKDGASQIDHYLYGHPKRNQ